MISSPTQVGTDSNWATKSTKIMGAPRVSLALKKDGTLWSWGNNSNGDLGLNNTTRYSSPVQVGTDTDWDKVNVNKQGGFQNVSHGIKTDGTLWVWGTSYYGQLGFGPSPTAYSSPVQLPGAWSMTSLGSDTVGGVKTDGTLWIWGNGDFGKTAQNNTTTYSSPKQVGSGTDWSVFSAGTYVCGAVKTDGTLWTWGQGAALAKNNPYPVGYSSPTQVPGTNWVTVTISESVGSGLKSDGSMWVWGAGNFGAMGDNTEISRSSPIQVGTSTDWLNRMKKGLGCTGQSGYNEGGLSF